MLLSFLEVEQLSKHYSGQAQPALSNVSFTANQSEIIAILGESGAGKSTLLRLMAGLEIPDSGHVWLDGRPVPDPSQKLVPGDMRVALIQQDFGLFNTMNIADNIAYPIIGLPPAKQQARVKELLELVKLPGIEKKMPAQLSGGERQRVAIARAMAAKPRLLLMDEPFSQMDYPMRRNLRKDLKRIILHEQTTVVMVTHEPSHALAVADKLLVMRSGKILQMGTPEEVYRYPNTEYVAMATGEVNILPTAILPLALQASLDRPAAKVCLRPEDMTLVPEKEALLRGTILSSEFAGAYRLVTVLLPSAHEIKVLHTGKPPVSGFQTGVAVHRLHPLRS
ncbi:MAG: ABC transporter ATP-binding protein [Cytophagales bacterium]|nr:ABC transporter ATP-binding protein [Bernardetiaceae bacterium]MDW8205729.1 ABC transporter ATP-binding protein [Cytophagales bacterium]